MVAAGFEPGSEFLWNDHYGEYWDLTQRSYREEFDPDYDGPLSAGIAFCQSGVPNCDADYDYASRPQAVKDALAKVALHGNIGKPLLTLHGTLDSLLPIRTDSDVYDGMVAGAGKDAIHRYYVIEHGNHVDGRYDAFPDRLKPILPCYRSAFTAMTDWVEKGSAPPPDQFVPDPHTGDVVNGCTLARSNAAPAAGGSTPAVGHRLEPRLTLTVAPRRDRRPPYRFRVSGRVVLPHGATRAEACGNGTVSVKVRTTGVSRRPPLGAKCRFRAKLRLGSRAHRRLRLTARFNGNRALVPASAHRRLRAG
jgi:hypothetical protein